MKYLYLLLLTLFLFSCNNWNENPVQEEEITHNVSGLIYKSAFPQNTSTFYAFKDDNWLLGTSDGCFYKSTDMGKSWAKKGEMAQKDKINSVYAFSIKMGNENKIFILAGTEKGIYVSKDDGESWKDAVIYSSETNEYIKVYFFSASYDAIYNKLTINGYGWDGKNSQFASVDEGISWIGTQIYPGKHVASIYTQLAWFERDLTGKLVSRFERKTYDGISGPSISKISVRNNKFIDFNISSGETVNCFVGGDDGYSYAGTKNGIYRTFVSSDNNWQLIGLKNQNVKSICRVSNKVFYACSDSGLYYSSDFGFNWVPMILSVNSIQVNKILNYNNIIYFLTDSSGVYNSELPKNAGGTIFNPLLLEPKNNEENYITDPIFKWLSLNKNNLENYILQISESKNFEEINTKTINLSGVLIYKETCFKNRTVYYWRLKAYNLYGSTDWTSPFKFSTK